MSAQAEFITHLRDEVDACKLERDRAEARAERLEAALIAALTQRPSVGRIERNEDMDRTYIPLPGGWEVQTKGNGSTFRIAGPNDERLPIPNTPYLHDLLERMARDIHAALSQQAAGVPAGVDWRALYRIQTAMRYMDNIDGLTRDKAFAMADDDVAGLEAFAAPKPDPRP